jgi:hypothetical protein
MRRIIGGPLQVMDERVIRHIVMPHVPDVMRIAWRVQ